MLLDVLLFFLLSSSAVVTGVGVARPSHGQGFRNPKAAYRPEPLFPHPQALPRFAIQRMWCRTFLGGTTVSRMPTIFVCISCHQHLPDGWDRDAFYIDGRGIVQFSRLLADGKVGLEAGNPPYIEPGNTDYINRLAGNWSQYPDVSYNLTMFKCLTHERI